MPISETWSKHPIESSKTPEKADTSCKIGVNNMACKLRIKSKDCSEGEAVSRSRGNRWTMYAVRDIGKNMSTVPISPRPETQFTKTGDCNYI